MLLNAKRQLQVVASAPGARLVQGSAEAVGSALYSTYLFPFEATSVILFLVAMVGAVVLSRDARRRTV